MQIIYALPFILLSGMAFFACMLARSLRRYALYALALPVVFGFSSLLGGIAVALAANLAAGLLPLDTATANGKSALIVLLVGTYIVSGLIGAWIAVRCIRWLQAWPE